MIDMKHFLKEKKELLIGAGAFWLFFGLIYYLYGLPAGPFAYAFLVTGALLIVWLYASCRNWMQHEKELEEMAQTAAEGFIGLPWAASRAEALYGQALMAVKEKKENAEQDLKRELEDAKQYYALWSHQIKTPLAALKLLMQEDEIDRRGAELELLKAEQYVEMALQYQRVAGGTGDLVFRKYELETLVKQAVKKTAPLFIYKKLGLKLESLSDTVVTDEKWLVFVLEQILTNAVKYTKQGSVFVYQMGEELVIADTGIGILPEDLPRVFEWGYTGLNGRIDKRSTGIGLSLCRQMLQRLGHSIRLESEPGKGTKVFLNLGRERFEIE